ncbi:MAG: DinB family protein [Anaerolineae bacterium]
MTLDVRHADLNALMGEARRIAADVNTQYGALSVEQLNWKPNAEAWSIGQNLDHIVTANATYFATLADVAAGRKVAHGWERVPVLPGVTGRLMVWGLDPKAARKMTAPQVFQPSQTDVPGDIVATFLQQQAELLSYMERTRSERALKTVITSPASSFVTYSVLDAYRIIIVHEQHHLVGVERLAHLPPFPPTT